MLSTFTTAFLCFLVLVGPVAAAPRPLAPLKRTPAWSSGSIAARSVPGSYIVQFASSANITVDRRATWLNNTLTKAGLSLDQATTESTLKLKWSKTVFDGFAGTMNAAAVDAIRAHQDVEYVAEDTVMYTSAFILQANAPWGIARISQRDALANQDPSQLTFGYSFDPTGGAGVDVYVVDTGVRVTHSDFGGRATFAATFGDGVPGQDINGHGTHCAGTVAGSTLGVAKSASILAVKVMSDDGSGATSDIISGINFATTQAAATGRPSIISMSLGGPINTAMDSAAANAVAAGVHVVVAAGNESADASTSSPARVPQVITVGAMTINDAVASFSNFGPGVDIFAPGQDVISASQASDTGVHVLSGTSMACPHVAGLAATLLTLNGNMTPAALQSTIISISTPGKLSAVPAGTVNNLAFNNAPVAA